LGNQSLLEGVPPAVNFVLTPEAGLLQPITIGGFEARNRIFMAPMTRSRSESDGTPSQLQVEYYTQRAGAGLIIGESTAVSAVGNGAYLNTPGIYTDRHHARLGGGGLVGSRGGRAHVPAAMARRTHGASQYKRRRPATCWAITDFR
jgi:hypothetical protein